MAVPFRNLNITSDAPVTQWGVEGISTAIDRGGPAEWEKINREIVQNPYGEVALDLEEALTITESPGITALMALALERARESEKEKLARKIRFWVKTSGKTRQEIADALGTSRSRLSTYENGHVVPSALVVETIRGFSERRRADLLP